MNPDERKGFSIFEWISLEILLTKCKWGNGGGVILSRTALLCIMIYIPYIYIKDSVDPNSICSSSFKSSWIGFAGKIEIAGVIFGAIYAALYTRFSSQWGYLAGLYNQIKQSELNEIGNDAVLAEWKAGFIEDAFIMHLAKRSVYSTIIKTWLDNENIYQAFLSNTRYSRQHLESIGYTHPTPLLVETSPDQPPSPTSNPN